MLVCNTSSCGNLKQEMKVDSMEDFEARIKELEAEVLKLKDEVFYWRTAFDRALVAYTTLERKIDGKPELY